MTITSSPPAPQTFFLLAQFGGESFAKVLGGKHLADLDLVAAAERRALHPRDRVIKRFGLDQPEAGDEVVGQRERPMGRAALPALILDSGPLRRRMQALARLHHAGLDQFLVELAHRGQEFRTRHHAGLRILARLHNHHEPHRLAPSACLASQLLARRTIARQQDEPGFAAPTCRLELFWRFGHVRQNAARQCERFFWSAIQREYRPGWHCRSVLPC